MYQQQILIGALALIAFVATRDVSAQVVGFRYPMIKKVEVFKEEADPSWFSVDRYNKISIHLRFSAASDSVDDNVVAAIDWMAKLNGKKSKSDEERAIIKSLSKFSKLSWVVSDDRCLEKSQKILDWNDANTYGQIYNPNLKKSDRYAYIVRQVVIQRAKKCANHYLKDWQDREEKMWPLLKYSEGPGAKKEKLKIQDAYLNTFVSKLVPILKSNKTFEDFFLPKSIQTPVTGDIAWQTIQKLGKLSNDSRLLNNEKPADLLKDADDLVEKYILTPSRDLNYLRDTFIAAAMDGRVIGDGEKFDWMKDEEFMKALQGFLLGYGLETDVAYLNEEVKSILSSL